MYLFKRLLFLAALLLPALSSLPAPASAIDVFQDRGVPSISGLHVAAGYEQLTLSTGAATALAAVPQPSSNRIFVTLAIITVEGNAVRFRDDGTDPTAAIGMPIPIGGAYVYTGDLSKLRFIRQSATSAVINVLYYY